MGKRSTARWRWSPGRGAGSGAASPCCWRSEGAAVVVNDLGASLDGEGVDTGPAATVVEEIRAAGGTAVANTDSVTDHQAVEGMVRQAIDEFGRFDILVNVAGILRDRMIFNMSPEEWQTVLDVHLKGTFNTSRFAADHFREHREQRRADHQHVVQLRLRLAGPAELRRRQGRHHRADTVVRQRAGTLRRDGQRHPAQRLDAHDRLDPQRASKPSRTPASCPANWPRAPPKTRTTSRRSSPGWPAMRRRASPATSSRPWATMCS